MTDNLQLEFNRIKDIYGIDSLSRIETLLTKPQTWRHSLQKEAKYVMPGLISKPWREINEYLEIRNIAKNLERFHLEIKREINQLNKEVDLDIYDHYKVALKNWKALYVFRNGRPVEKNKNIIPKTFQFYEDYLTDLICPLGEVHFSVLSPKTKIPPHSDLWNFTLNLHFAIEIPEDCGIRVGTETREWKEGECLLFDYSYEHEAWNNSDDTRVCLLMDLWNPEVTLAERKAIIALIKEIRSLMKMQGIQK